MATLKDILDKVNIVETMIRIYGATELFMDEYGRRLNNLIDAIAAENNMSFDGVAHLPDQTGLGEKAEQIFNELTVWFGTQHEDLA